MTIPTLLSKTDFDCFHPDHVAEHYGLEYWADFVSQLESEIPEEKFEDGVTYELYKNWHIEKYSKLADVLK